MRKRKLRKESKMPRALFTSKNLIGDALYIQLALKRWVEEHPGWDIDLLTLNDHITCLYEGMGIPNLRVIFERDEGFASYYGNYDFEHVFNVNDAFALGDKELLHISQAYMKLLGQEVPSLPPRVEYIPPDGPCEEDKVLLSMFSNSCASREGKPPNKMLSWTLWMEVLTLARQFGDILVPGGPKDEGAAPLPLLESEYYCGKSLPEVARTLRRAKLLITIDNGMGHLAATQGTPTILFYPKCLGQHWIIPSGNPNLVVFHVDPVYFDATMGKRAVREGIKTLTQRRTV